MKRMRHSRGKGASQSLCAVLAAVALTVAACQGAASTPPDDTPADDPGEPTTTTAAADTTVAAAEGDIVVDFWHGYGEHRQEWIEEAATRYTEMTDGVTIRTESKADYDALFDAMLLAAGTDAAPELAQIVVTFVDSALASEAFKMVSEVDVDGKVDPEFFAPVIDQLTVDGELTSIPFAHSGPIMFYDKGLFEEAGLDPESPPRTWSELLDVCEAIVDEAAVAEACIGIPWHPWFFENLLATQGVPLLNNGNGRNDRATGTAIDSEAGIKVAEFWRELYERGYYPHAAEGYDFPRVMFTESRTAISLSSIADAGYFATTLEEQGRDLGTGFFPVADGDAPGGGTTLGGASNWITAGLEPEVEQAALDFALWLAGPEQSADWHTITGYFPLTPGAEAVLEEDGWFEENPAFRTALDQLQQTEPSPATVGPFHAAMPEVNDAIITAMEQILVGDADIPTALGEAAVTSREAIERLNASLEG